MYAVAAEREVTVHDAVIRGVRTQPVDATLGVPLVPAICNTLQLENEQPALEHVVPAVHASITIVDGFAADTCARLLLVRVGAVAAVAVVKDAEVTIALEAPAHVHTYLTWNVNAVAGSKPATVQGEVTDPPAHVLVAYAPPAALCFNS